MDPEKEKAAAPETDPDPSDASALSEIDLSKLGGTLVHHDENYEAKATRDAIRRAHDAELEALANLAIFRNNTDGRNMMMVHLERDQFLSPREVDKRLHSAEAAPKPPKKEKE